MNTNAEFLACTIEHKAIDNYLRTADLLATARARPVKVSGSAWISLVLDAEWPRVGQLERDRRHACTTEIERDERRGCREYGCTRVQYLK
jgi:hypothetical protein